MRRDTHAKRLSGRSAVPVWAGRQGDRFGHHVIHVALRQMERRVYAASAVTRDCEKYSAITGFGWFGAHLPHQPFPSSHGPRCLGHASSVALVPGAVGHASI